MSFVCKQTAVLVVRINTLPHTSFSLTSCISIVFSVLNILTHMTTVLRVGSLPMGLGQYIRVKGHIVT